MLFTQLGLTDPILKALHDEGYEKPTPIQAQAIPIVLKEQDLLGCAQTGTGKTAAFSIPVLQILSHKKPKQQGAIRCLILTPTRELAIQIGESIHAYGRHLRIKHTVIFGGVSQGAQTRALQAKPEILVATPGRLIDLINQGFISLKHLEVLVLDEADRMLDMGFIHDVKRILKLVPEERQTLFFSATMPEEIRKLAAGILKNPQRVEVTPVSSTAEKIQQQIFFVNKGDKKALLNDMLRDKSIRSALVFTRTKHGANKVVKDLIKEGITAEAIHGNKAQNARQKALSNFKAGTTRVLVATDIAARGIDIDLLSHVINYEIPNIPETYVHRIGRTGRAGAGGIAYSFCDEEEKSYLRDIQKLIKIEIPVNEQHPWHLKGGRPLAAPVKTQGSSNPNSSAPKAAGGQSKNNRNRGRNFRSRAPQGERRTEGKPSLSN